MHSFNLWPRKSPLAPRPWSCQPCTTTTEPCSRACAPQQETPPQWDASTRQLESSRCLPQLEKARVQPWRWGAAKNKLLFLKSEFTATVLSSGSSGYKPACRCRRRKRCGFEPWVGKIPWRRAWQPIPVLLPGELHRQRNPAGYSPLGRKELDRTEVT